MVHQYSNNKQLLLKQENMLTVQLQGKDSDFASKLPVLQFRAENRRI